MKVIELSFQDGQEPQALCEWWQGKMWVPISCLGKIVSLDPDELPMWVPEPNA